MQDDIDVIRLRAFTRSADNRAGWCGASPGLVAADPCGQEADLTPLATGVIHLGPW